MKAIFQFASVLLSRMRTASQGLDTNQVSLIIPAECPTAACQAAVSNKHPSNCYALTKRLGEQWRVGRNELFLHVPAPGSQCGVSEVVVEDKAHVGSSILHVLFKCLKPNTKNVMGHTSIL